MVRAMSDVLYNDARWLVGALYAPQSTIEVTVNGVAGACPLSANDLLCTVP